MNPDSNNVVALAWDYAMRRSRVGAALADALAAERACRRNTMEFYRTATGALRKVVRKA